MNNLLLYLVTLVLLAASFARDKKKTKMALMKSWKSLANILPEFIGVIVLVGMMLAVLNPQVISRLIGQQSGWFGVVVAAVVGAITQNGAGYMQIGAFVSALMMVGFVTIPVETKYFGRRLTVWRNSLAFVFSFIVALVIGRVVGGL